MKNLPIANNYDDKNNSHEWVWEEFVNHIEKKVHTILEVKNKLESLFSDDTKYIQVYQNGYTPIFQWSVWDFKKYIQEHHNFDTWTIRNISDKDNHTLFRFAPSEDGEAFAHNFLSVRVLQDVIQQIQKQKLLSIMNEWYPKNRNSFGDTFFEVSHWILPSEDVFEKINDDIGFHFDAHGIAKWGIFQQIESLENILSKWIDTTRKFYTAPFSVPKSYQSMASGMWTISGTAYKDWAFVLVSWYDKSLDKDGIEIIFVNDGIDVLLPYLREKYPKYTFHLLSEQKQVLEHKIPK